MFFGMMAPNTSTDILSIRFLVAFSLSLSLSLYISLSCVVRLNVPTVTIIMSHVKLEISATKTS